MRVPCIAPDYCYSMTPCASYDFFAYSLPEHAHRKECPRVIGGFIKSVFPYCRVGLGIRFAGSIGNRSLPWRGWEFAICQRAALAPRAHKPHRSYFLRRKMPMPCMPPCVHFASSHPALHVLCASRSTICRGRDIRDFTRA